jgi:ribosomal protein L12E/L44/L45/RPP1/RPP2
LLRLDAGSVKQRTQKLGIMVNGKSVSQPVSPLNSDDDIDLKPVTMQQQQGTTTATKAAAAAAAGKGGGGKEEEDEEEENLDLEFGKYHTVDPDKMRVLL